MLEPRVERVYCPSLGKSILRTMGVFFVSGYAVGTSLCLAAGTRCDYAQYFANWMCVAGMGLQLARGAAEAVAARIKR